MPARGDLVIALLGRGISTFGDGLAVTALTLRLQADGARPYTVGLLLGAGTLPLLLLAGPVGRLVDGHDSRRLLVGGGLIEVAATLPLIVLHAVVPVVALVALLGGAAAVTAATWSALLPHIVGDDQVGTAVSAQQSLALLVFVGAPAVGGLLTGEYGSGVPVAADAASFGVVTIAAALVGTRRIPRQTADTGGQRAGLSLLRSDPMLAPLLAGVSVVVLLVGMVDVVLVYLVRGTLHAGGGWYGLVEAAWILGMVAGSLSVGRIGSDPGRVRATTGGSALACAAAASFAGAPSAGVLVPLAVLGGIGNGAAATALSTLLTTRTPTAARGRVSAAANAVLGTAQGASLLVGGAVSLVLAPRAVYAVAGLLGLAASGGLAVAVARHEPRSALVTRVRRHHRVARPSPAVPDVRR